MRTLIVILALCLPISGCTDSTPPSSETVDINAEIKAFNSMVAGVKDVRFPEMRYGINKSSMEMSKPGILKFRTSLLGRTEIEAATEGDLFWFWSRSFDQDSIYHCRRDKLRNTRLRPELYPCIARGLLCVDPIAPEGTTSPVSTTTEDGLLREVDLREGRITSQVFKSDGQVIISMSFLEFQLVDGIKLPRKVKIKWHREDVEITLDMGKAVLNSGFKPSTEMPNKAKVNLEDI